MTEAAKTAPPPPNVHNGTYTVSHPTQGHFTLKLYTSSKGGFAGKRILSLLTGPDNVTNYKGVAFWDDERQVVHVWRRFRGERNIQIDGYHWIGGEGTGLTTTQKKLAIWADLAIRGDGTELKEDGTKRHGFWAGEGYRLLLEGRCLVCNRKLTEPESIRLGVGPKCGGRA